MEDAADAQVVELPAAPEVADEVVVPVPHGDRVLVVADLRLSGTATDTSREASRAVGRAIGDLQGPATLVFAGDMFDLRDGRAQVDVALGAHPRLASALAAFVTGPEHHFVVLPGTRDGTLRGTHRGAHVCPARRANRARRHARDRYRVRRASGPGRARSSPRLVGHVPRRAATRTITRSRNTSNAKFCRRSQPATRPVLPPHGWPAWTTGDDHLHDLRRAVADLQAEHVAQPLLERKHARIAAVAVGEQALLHDLGGELGRPPFAHGGLGRCGAAPVAQPQRAQAQPARGLVLGIALGQREGDTPWKAVSGLPKALRSEHRARSRRAKPARGPGIAVRSGRGCNRSPASPGRSPGPVQTSKWIWFRLRCGRHLLQICLLAKCCRFTGKLPVSRCP